MKQLVMVVTILSFMLSMPVQAADDMGNFIVPNPITCGEWVKAIQEKGIRESAYKWWIAGYIGSFNSHTKDVYNILGNTDLESVYLWLNNYCQANPLKSLPEGMLDLMVELWPMRQTKDD